MIQACIGAAIVLNTFNVVAIVRELSPKLHITLCSFTLRYKGTMWRNCQFSKHGSRNCCSKPGHLMFNRTPRPFPKIALLPTATPSFYLRFLKIYSTLVSVFGSLRVEKACFQPYSSIHLSYKAFIVTQTIYLWWPI